MGITREFIGWKQPVLVRAVEYLLDRFATTTECDLGDVIVVLPGRRAGRRLLELLVEITADRFPDFVPPQIETVGTLPELLFVNRFQYADVLTCNLVWSAALREAASKALRAVLPQAPKRDDFDGWMALADLVRKQHRELASEGLDFEDAAIACRDAKEHAEADRWFALRAVQQDYHNRMDKIRYWDRQTSRLIAVRQDEVEIDRPIVLVGTVDMNRAVRNMLVPIEQHVTSLIAAPQEFADHFDEFGTLVPEAWATSRLDLLSEQVQVVDRPDDQAAAVVDTITGYDGRYRADEITIGVADDRLIPHLQRHLDECNVSTRWFDGQHLDQTPPFRLFELLADFIAGLLPGDDNAKYWNFDAFAGLVRHPDLFDWIEANFVAPPPKKGAPKHWLVQLDEYRTKTFNRIPGTGCSDRPTGNRSRCCGPRSATSSLSSLRRANVACCSPTSNAWTNGSNHSARSCKRFTRSETSNPTTLQTPSLQQPSGGLMKSCSTSRRSQNRFCRRSTRHMQSD